MKVAIVIDGLGGGGAERQAILATHALRLRGHHVDLISYHDTNAYQGLLTELGISVHLVSGRSLRRLAGLTAMLRCNQYDLVHGFKINSSLNLFLPSALGGSMKFVAGCRGLEKATMMRTMALQFIANRADCWVVNSRAVERFVAERLGVLGERICVVPNAFLLSEFDDETSIAEAKRFFNLDDRKFSITIVGRLHEVKGHRFYLRVAAKLSRMMPDCVQFVVAGDGELREPLEQYARELGLADRVSFIGRCEQVGMLLKAADVVVSTSKTEGLPNVMIEAGAAGRPCVVTNSGGVLDVIQNSINGYVVDFCEQTMASRIAELLSSERLCGEMGNAAKELVKIRFSVEALGENLERAYGES